MANGVDEPTLDLPAGLGSGSHKRDGEKRATHAEEDGRQGRSVLGEKYRDDSEQRTHDGDSQVVFEHSVCLLELSSLCRT